MPRVPFTPPPGIVSDNTAFADRGLWVAGSNMRPHHGSMQTIGGSTSLFADNLAGVCRNLLVWTDASGNRLIAFGQHNALEVKVAASLLDITPSGLSEGSVNGAGTAPGYGSGPYGGGTYSTPDSQFYPRTWSLDTWGHYLIANPRGETIYVWDLDPSGEAAAISDAPTRVTAALVTPERQILALGCNEESSDDFNPMCIRGCKIGDYEDWSSGPGGDEAFEHILEGAGRIVNGKMVGPFVAIWTDHGLHVGQFIGTTEQKYRFDPVARHCGLIAPNAVIVIGQRAYWISPDRQWWTWTPGDEPRIIDCPISKDFQDNLSLAQADKIIATGRAKFGEVWWYYPDRRDGIENSRYVAFNYLGEGLKWFPGIKSRTADVDGGLTTAPIAADAAGNVYAEEVETENVICSITSADQYFSEAEQFLQIQRFWPDFAYQTGDVTLTIRTRKYPQGPVLSTKTITIAPGDLKKDFRVSGRVAQLTMSCTGRFRTGKAMFDAIPLGEN
jgi:hypothetical protein